MLPAANGEGHEGGTARDPGPGRCGGAGRNRSTPEGPARDVEFLEVVARANWTAGR